MSLLRLLPTLRTLPAQRTCIAALSYSAPLRADSENVVKFDNMLDRSNTALAESGEDAATPLPLEDLPPRAHPESYPLNPPRMNPVTAARERERKQSSVGGALRPIYSVSVKSSRNNTIVTFARPNGNQLVTLTGGKLGFKKSNRNGYEAGYQCAVGIIAAMEEEMRRMDFEWELYLKGFGQGRDAMLTALTTAVGTNVKSRLRRVTDRTPLKIGGTRGQKARRI